MENTSTLEEISPPQVDQRLSEDSERSTTKRSYTVQEPNHDILCPEISMDQNIPPNRPQDKDDVVDTVVAIERTSSQHPKVLEKSSEITPLEKPHDSKGSADVREGI